MQCLNLITSPLCRPTSWRGSIHLFQPPDSPQQSRKLRRCSSELGQGGAASRIFYLHWVLQWGCFFAKASKLKEGVGPFHRVTSLQKRPQRQDQSAFLKPNLLCSLSCEKHPSSHSKLGPSAGGSFLSKRTQ